MSLTRLPSSAPAKPPTASALAPAATALPPAGQSLVGSAGDRLVASANAKEAAGLAAMKAWVAQERSLPLQAGAGSYVVESQVRPAKGVAVLFHGFTACPWQMEGLAKQLAAEGIHVLVPRLPGHGLMGADGKPDNSDLPGPHEAGRYEALADEAYALAAATGLPVSAAGLSVGGATALAMAERHPVSRVVAIAPYLRPGRAAWALDAIMFLDKITFGVASRVIGLLPWGLPDEVQALTKAGKRPGHATYQMGNLVGATRLGSSVVANAGRIQGQVQILSTANDGAADLGAMRRLAAALPGGAPTGWQHYPTEEGVPHPMNDPLESAPKAKEVEGIAADFMAGGRPSRRLPPAEG